MDKTTRAFPVPAVRLIISDEKGRILLLKRAGTEYAEGFWCLPGGKVDYGSTVKGAVVNELMEETALRCNSAEFLFFRDSLPEKPGGMHCIVFYFRCAVEGTIRLNPESSDYAWAGPAELADYRVAFGNDIALRDYWESKGCPKA